MGQCKSPYLCTCVQYCALVIPSRPSRGNPEFRGWGGPVDPRTAATGSEMLVEGPLGFRNAVAIHTGRQGPGDGFLHRTGTRRLHGRVARTTEIPNWHSATRGAYSWKSMSTNLRNLERQNIFLWTITFNRTKTSVTGDISSIA